MSSSPQLATDAAVMTSKAEPDTRSGSSDRRKVWLGWLSRARFVVITLVLGLQLGAESYSSSHPLLGPFLTLVTIWYMLAAFYLLLQRTFRVEAWQPLLQLYADAIIITGLVYTTGLSQSLLTELYALLVMVSAMVVARRHVYLLGGVCALLYAVVSQLAWRGVLPSPWGSEKPDAHGVQLSLILTTLAMFAAAYISSLLSNRLQEADARLVTQQGVLDSLRALNDNIVHSMSGGLITTDLGGRIYFANQSAGEILGCPQGELDGKNVEEMLQLSLPPDSFPRRKEHTFRQGAYLRTLGISVTPLQVPGQGNVGRVYQFQDLTQLRQLEHEIEVRERMSALGRLAAGIAHEIRNPLASLGGSVRLLAGYLHLGEQEQELMDIVVRESDRLNRIVSDFLSYARDYHYEFRQVELGSLVRDVVTLARNGPRCGAGVEIVMRMGAGPIVIWGDPDRLKQVFWNLCDNALKAVAGQGSLTIAAEPSSAGVRLEFRDTGCGLPPGAEAHIFEPFNSHFKDGTGLGLATAYAIMQAHQGKIWVESPPEGGACFVLQLPIQPGAAGPGN